MREADIVITMFPGGQHVLDAYRGVDGGEGLLAAARPNTLFVDCSTIAVDDARAAADLAIAAGHRAVDAPVSGGVMGATAATLAFMVGGEETDVAEVRPLLEAHGSPRRALRRPGLGQAAKVCNNMILGVSMIAVSEAFVLGEKLGLSHDALFDVAANASGQCWALTTNCPVPGPVPGAPRTKTTSRASREPSWRRISASPRRRSPPRGCTPSSGRSRAELYARFADGPGARRDFSAIIEEIRDRSDEGLTR